MILEVEGIPYDFFTSISTNVMLEALSRQFTFTATRAGQNALPFRGGEACRVLDRGEPIATGHIERLDVDYEDERHRIVLSGRDKTGDLVDSSIAELGDLNAPITLKRCVQRVAGNIGASYTVIDRTGGVAYQKAADMVAPEPGQNAFEFLEALARRRQVLLTSDGDGNVVLTRAATERSQGSLQNILGADDNNIIAASSSYDNTGRFRDYKTVSGLNPLALNAAGKTGLDQVVDQPAQFTDPDVRSGRQMALVPESPLASDTGLERARWEANVRKARGRLYSATVQGLRETPDGPLWSVNRIVRIVDEFAGIDGDMLISGVAFNFSESRGTTTTLTLVATNSYTLELNQPRNEKVADGFLD